MWNDDELKEHIKNHGTDNMRYDVYAADKGYAFVDEVTIFDNDKIVWQGDFLFEGEYGKWFEEIGLISEDN